MTEPRFGFDEPVGNGAEQHELAGRRLDRYRRQVPASISTAAKLKLAAPAKNKPALGQSACGHGGRCAVTAALPRLLARRAR